MKDIKLLFAIFCISIFFATNVKAQDDDDLNTGWYVDGYKVSSISCYNFGKLQFIVPYSTEMESYDHISIRFWRGPKENSYSGVKIYSLSALKGLKKGNYIVFSVITTEQAMPLQQNGYPDGAPSPSQSSLNFSINRWDCAYQVVDIGDGKKKETAAADVILNATLYGLSVTEIEESYDESCKCIKKREKYNSTKIMKSYPITLTGRIWKKWNAALNTEEVCTYSGTKVDFNILGKSESSVATTPEKKATVATKPTAEKSTATAKTSSVAVSSSLNTKSLKPLDKTKPGYFAEKNESGKVIREGYKKGKEILIGEIRMYDDDGRLIHIYTYVNDEQTGYEAEYDSETGNILKSGNNKAGQKDGEWKRYKDGKLVGTDTYVDGEKQ